MEKYLFQIEVYMKVTACTISYNIKANNDMEALTKLIKQFNAKHENYGDNITTITFVNKLTLDTAL